ncbi:nucleotidyltransferase family protein [Actinomadura sp. 6N118]|uniref:nucleotidyltransferase family protein n=1 Tax=Actinomadura sp. 6N118 TaxID=3375151 RepID=UPI00379AC9C1
MTERDILIWAAGGAHPVDPQFRDDLLLTAAQAHRLGTRLRQRLDTERPRWASSSLIDAVAGLATDAQQRSARLHEAYTEILRAAIGEARPVLSKGIVYPLLLQTEQSITWSADLDLFAPSPESLRDALTELGYILDPKDPPAPYGRIVLHEYGKLDRGEIQIDLHNHFPAWRYPPLEAIRRTRPPAISGSWEVPSSLERGQVAAPQLVEASIQAMTPAGVRLPVTSPEMTAIISCCHIFANHLTEFRAPYATIRLGEVANLFELLQKSEFSWARFHRIVVDVGAQDAAAYAFAVINELLDQRLVPPEDAALPDEPLPPRALWFARGEGALLISTAGVECPRDVVINETPEERVIQYLGTSRIRAGYENGTEWHSSCPSEERGVRRVLLQTPASRKLHFRFAFVRTESGLRFLIDVPSTSPGCEVDFLLHLGNCIYELVQHPKGEFYAYDRRTESRIADETVRLSLRDDAIYVIDIDWSRVADKMQTAEITMLLGVREWEADGGRPAATTMIPLQMLINEA